MILKMIKTDGRPEIEARIFFVLQDSQSLLYNCSRIESLNQILEFEITEKICPGEIA